MQPVARSVDRSSENDASSSATRKSLFLTSKSELLTRKSLFLTSKSELLTRKSLFLTSKSELLTRKSLFLTRQKRIAYKEIAFAHEHIADTDTSQAKEYLSSVYGTR